MNLKSNQPSSMEVLVFQTNIRLKKDLRKLSPWIEAEERIRKWNVDLADCSKVLRIEALCLQPAEVIQLLHRAGYQCEELPD